MRYTNIWFKSIILFRNIFNWEWCGPWIWFLWLNSQQKKWNVNFNVVSNNSWYISGENFVKHFFSYKTQKPITKKNKQYLFSKLCFLEVAQLHIMAKLTLIGKLSHSFLKYVKLVEFRDKKDKISSLNV